MKKVFAGSFILGVMTVIIILLMISFINLNKEVKVDTQISNWVYTNIIQPNEQKAGVVQTASPATQK
jgi:hypothetical protein